MTDQPYIPPRWDADDAEMEAAAERLSTVKLTREQFEAAPSVFRLDAEAAVIAYCRDAGLEPADLVAHAIMAKQMAVYDLHAAALPNEEFGRLYIERVMGAVDPTFLITAQDDELPRKDMFDPDQHLMFED